MDWKPIASLEPGKLAFLMFEHLQSAQWVGYVNDEGVCAWPEKVRGLTPSAWQPAIVDLTRVQILED